MRRGTALVEYVGAIVVVGALMLGLMALRVHRPARTPPVHAVERLARLVASPPPAPVTRPRPPAVSRPRPHRPRRPRPPRPAVLVPGWATGW